MDCFYASHISPRQPKSGPAVRFSRQRGISVIVATLLLVAISVSAAVVLYVFASGLAGSLTQNGGQPVTEKLTIQSYTFAVNPGSCACSQQVIEIFLLNPGPAATTISSVYYDGALLAVTVPPIADTSLTNDVAYLVPSTSTLASAALGKIHFAPSGTQKTTYSVTDVGQVVITFTSVISYGTGHTVKVVSTTGSTNVYTVVSGISG